MKDNCVKFSNTASWAVPFLGESLLVSFEIESPRKDCTLQPSILETCFGIESQIIVTFLISVIKIKDFLEIFYQP